MSKIYKGKSGLKKDRNKMRLIIGLIILINLEGIYLYIKNLIDLKWTLGFLFISILSAGFLYKKIKILSAGLKGEKISAKILKSLGRDYSVFNNVIIPGRSGSREIDLIVVSKFGVFVVEVKNYKGKIIGNTENNIWHQIKTSKSGNEYSNEIRNPINQLNMQLSCIHSYLKRYQIDMNIEGVVYFSKSEARLFIENRYRIVQGKKQLLNYINDNDEQMLTAREKSIVEKKIKECLQ